MDSELKGRGHLKQAHYNDNPMIMHIQNSYGTMVAYLSVPTCIECFTGASYMYLF